MGWHIEDGMREKRGHSGQRARSQIESSTFRCQGAAKPASHKHGERDDHESHRKSADLTKPQKPTTLWMPYRLPIEIIMRVDWKQLLKGAHPMPKPRIIPPHHPGIRPHLSP